MTPEAQRQINAMQNKIDTLEESVVKLTESVDELVKAWGTAKGMTSFIKWLASLASACGVLYAALHDKVPK
jgi:hypothetical protein